MLVPISGGCRDLAPPHAQGWRCCRVAVMPAGGARGVSRTSLPVMPVHWAQRGWDTPNSGDVAKDRGQGAVGPITPGRVAPQSQ